MKCRRCGQRAELEENGLCAACASDRAARRSGVVKTSTIVVAAGETTSVYRSLRELPLELRRRLRRATNGVNSGTILIADKRGREEIARAMRKLPSLQSGKEPPRAWEPSVQQGVAVLLIACTLILIWLVLTRRF